jgi:6-pyruvoyltetrahydropterin/6-carboxytetrahydropterin synthase
MTTRYTVKVINHFASAHTLRNYPGACQRMHGHNWKLETKVVANELDEMGMAVDFKVIKKAVQALADQLDHRYLNEIPPFDVINPTAENIAQWFFKRLSETLNDERIRVKSVTIWETEFACATYKEDA